MAGLIDLQQTGYSLVLGGARSGKSAYAEAVIEAAGGGFYVATSEALDDEMKARIETHKARRGDQWQTLEEPILLEHALRQLIGRGKPALVDCLTLWLSNLMELEKNIDAEIDALCALVDDLDFPVVFVSNEVGQGIIPDNALARRFVDCAGIMNQKIAAVSKSVILMTAGLPQKIK
ncbi:MAG: bifunctional adenosylcobinamide kinase/adenosylcobinamide-phosphate guanylyltransferase [Rhodospirillales bacterium]|jgi:adenosylcobinamide kinase/adenosylcobinamide-phosphate guanylyltransferase